MVLELIEAQEWGPSSPKIPYTAAKERLAHITAAKAVAMALTPGLDPIKVTWGHHHWIHHLGGNYCQNIVWVCAFTVTLSEQSLVTSLIVS